MNIEKKYYHVTVTNELQSLKDRRAKLNSAASDRVMASMTPFDANNFRQFNGNNPYDGMSDYERRQQAERLDVAIAGLYSKIVNAFANDWAAVKSEYRTLRREQAGAADRASKSWDFGRLAYEKGQVRDFLSKADLSAISKRYEATEIAGDRHALRALAEAGLEVLQERQFTGQNVSRAVDLRQDFEKMRDDLVTTKEQRDLLKQSSILSSKIAELHDATNRTAGDYFKIDMLGTDAGPFKQMTAGVQVKRAVDPTDLAMTTSVDVRGPGWDEPATDEGMAAEVRALAIEKGLVKA